MIYNLAEIGVRPNNISKKYSLVHLNQKYYLDLTDEIKAMSPDEYIEYALGEALSVNPGLNVDLFREIIPCGFTDNSQELYYYINGEFIKEYSQLVAKYNLADVIADISKILKIDQSFRELRKHLKVMSVNNNTVSLYLYSPSYTLNLMHSLADYAQRDFTVVKDTIGDMTDRIAFTTLDITDQTVSGIKYYMKDFTEDEIQQTEKLTGSNIASIKDDLNTDFAFYQLSFMLNENEIGRYTHYFKEVI